MYECPEDTDTGPSTSQSSSRSVHPKPVQATLEAVFNRDRSRKSNVQLDP